MKTHLFSIYFAVVASNSYAQNLVPNPGFENYKRLPCKLNEFLIQELLYDWMQPLGTTTDYWNNKSDSNCVLNPGTIGKTPRTGSGMAGLIGAHIFMNFSTTYREYIETRLNKPLVPNRLYYGEFYAINRNKIMHAADILESNNLGLALSESLISDFSSSQPDHLFLRTQLRENKLITADASLQKVSACFIADKAYEYLLIGNFDTVESTSINRLTNQNEDAYAYYFVDDVSLVELPYNVSSLASEVIFCSNASQVELNAYVTGATAYEWESGETSSAINIQTKQDNQYTVSIYFNECVHKHSFPCKIYTGY